MVLPLYSKNSFSIIPSPPQSPFVLMDANLWLEIFLFLPSLREVVKTWVAFCLSKHGISVQHQIWFQLLSLASLDTNAFLLRTNYPTSAIEKQGLVFFARLHKKKKCSRSGCFMEFIECENTANSCRFHPGKKTAVGYLSCCRAKNFKETGCSSRFHTGGTYIYYYTSDSLTHFSLILLLFLLCIARASFSFYFTTLLSVSLSLSRFF